MSKNSNVSLFFYRSRIGYIIGAILVSIIFLSILYITWIVPIGPHKNGSYSGELRYWLLKYFCIPVCVPIIYYLFKIALSKTAKIVELRVGNDGIWRWGFNSKTYFIPWNEIIRIHVIKQRVDGRILIFEIKNPKKYRFLMFAQGGVNYLEHRSPVSFEELVTKLSKFKEFKDRFDANSLE